MKFSTRIPAAAEYQLHIYNELVAMPKKSGKEGRIRAIVFALYFVKDQ